MLPAYSLDYVFNEGSKAVLRFVTTFRESFSQGNFWSRMVDKAVAVDGAVSQIFRRVATSPLQNLRALRLTISDELEPLRKLSAKTLIA